MADNITIAEAIKQLRAQLEEAQREGADKALHFAFKSVEVELGIVFKSEREGGGGIKAWFVDVSGKAKSGDEATHKIKLVLKPLGPNLEDTYVSDDQHEHQ